MKKFLLSLLLLGTLSTYSQEASRLNGFLGRIRAAVPSYIPTSSGSSRLIEALDELNADITKAVRADGLHKDSLVMLLSTKSKGEALKSFVNAAGNVSTYFPRSISQNEMKLLTNSLSIPLTIVDSAKHCLELYQVSLGDFRALLAIKKGNSESRFKIEVKVKYNKGKTSQSFGTSIFNNEYYRVWSNQADLNIKEYEVAKVECG